MAEPAEHTHTHTLLSCIDHTDAANLLELGKLVYLPEGARGSVCVECVSSSRVSPAVSTFLDKMFGDQRVCLCGNIRTR